MRPSRKRFLPHVAGRIVSLKAACGARRERLATSECCRRLESHRCDADVNLMSGLAHQTARFLVLLGVLTGCGGVPGEGPVGFINQTQHNDADLWTIWQAAQASVAKQVNLNPVQQSQAGATAQTLPGS